MRAVELWIGKNDDTPAPPRVFVRCFERYGGKCGACGRKVGAGLAWQLDHIIALANGGQNQEGNLQPLCVECHRQKTNTDVATKSKIARVRAKHVGVKKRGRPIPGSKASGWRRRFDGTVERR